MKNPLNYFKIFLVISLFMMIVMSCSNSVGENESDDDESILTEAVITVLSIQQPAFTVVSYKQSVTLSCKADTENSFVSYQWYRCDDMSGKNPQLIRGATSKTYKTPVFTEKEIRYYYCVAKVWALEKKSDIVAVAYTGLPIVKINTDNIALSSITRESYVPVELKIIMPNGTEISKNLTKKGMKGRGNSSWSMPKKGYNLNFDDKESFFGLTESKKWCLVANYSDKTLLRNKYASMLGNDIFNCEWNPSFVSVDLIINGEYLGNYIFCEKNTISEDRIDIQDISDCTQKKIQNGKYVDKNNDGVVDFYDGGFLMEIDRRYDADFYFTSTQGVAFTLKDPDEVTEQILEHIKTIVQSAEDALYADDFSDNSDENPNLSKWMKFCDVDSFIDWYFVNEIGKNRDARFSLSVYMYYNPIDGKLHLGPNWDFDPAFGNDGENGSRLDLQSSTGFYIRNSKWISRMFEDPRFVTRVKERWNEKKGELQRTFAKDGAIQTMADEIKISADLNFLRWPILGIYVWPNPAGSEDRTTYQSEINYMKSWLSSRYVWINTTIEAL